MVLVLLSAILTYLASAARLAGVHLSMEEIAVTSAAQIHKLEVVLGELNNILGIRDDSFIKWNVKRESHSQQCLKCEATSKQMFSSGTTVSKQDLMLAVGCCVS